MASGGWDFTDHSCRVCMGRVMSRGNEFRCAECAESVIGKVYDLCWCGVDVTGHGLVFECFKNQSVTTETPQEVLVRERKK